MALEGVWSGMRHASKYEPHQGKRERARRLRQHIARGGAIALNTTGMNESEIEKKWADLLGAVGMTHEHDDQREDAGAV